MAKKHNAKAMHFLATVTKSTAKAVQQIVMRRLSSSWYQNAEKRNAKKSEALAMRREVMCY